jgi:hypothetical protein
MKLGHTKISIRLITAVTCMAFFAGCATAPQTARGPEYAPTASIMREARSPSAPVETRAADYLQAAAVTAPLLGAGTPPTPAVNTYNAAAAEVTLLLRSAEGGRLWDRRLTLADKSRTYHLRLEPGHYPSTWAPDYFTSFEGPDQIKRTLVRKDVTRDGVGGALVGVRAVTPQEEFAPPKGMAAAVTATLDFHGSDASLALRKPSNDPDARVDGKTRPLDADFSAPISYFQPPKNLLLSDTFSLRKTYCSLI